MTYIPEDLIVFWTVFALLLWGAKLALFVFSVGLLYNLAVSIRNHFKKGNP